MISNMSSYLTYQNSPCHSSVVQAFFSRENDPQSPPEILWMKAHHLMDTELETVTTFDYSLNTAPIFIRYSVPWAMVQKESTERILQTISNQCYFLFIHRPTKTASAVVSQYIIINFFIKYKIFPSFFIHSLAGMNPQTGFCG